MKHLQVLLLGLSLTAFTACDLYNICGSTKEEFLTNYSTFIEEIGEQKLEHDAAEWEKSDRKFKEMVNGCYKKYEAEMTAAEEVEFWTNALAYYYYRYGTNMVAVLSDGSDDLSVTVSKKVKEVLDNPMVIMRNFLGKDKSNEVDDLMDELESDLNKWSKKLEQLFE